MAATAAARPANKSASKAAASKNTRAAKAEHATKARPATVATPSTRKASAAAKATASKVKSAAVESSRDSANEPSVAVSSQRPGKAATRARSASPKQPPAPARSSSHARDPKRETRKPAEAVAKPAAKAAPSVEKNHDQAPSPPVAKKPARKSIKEAAGVSSDAVARRTGKNWDDWFEVLDNAGAATLDQRGIVAILAQKHGIGPWWQQMIAVGYESLRSKSDRPPAADGFQINSSCTLDAPLARVFRLWNDAGERARWLSDDRFVVRGTSGEKTLRARWGKGASHVAVSFSEKSGRTQVSVEHLQIESRDAAEQMKAYWAKKLALLDQALARR